jgi:hypothetical protein
VLTALPVNGENDFTRRLVHVCDYIDDQRPNQLLAHAHRDAWSFPGGIEVLGELRKVRRSDRCRRCVRSLQACLAGLYTTQRCFPILLQLRGDLTVIGVAGGVASLCQRGFVLSLLQFKFDETTCTKADSGGANTVGNSGGVSRD